MSGPRVWRWSCWVESVVVRIGRLKPLSTWWECRPGRFLYARLVAMGSLPRLLPIRAIVMRGGERRYEALAGREYGLFVRAVR